MSTPEKRCGKCKDPKPATEEYFHASSRSKSGLQDWCKVCMCAYQRDRAAAKKAAKASGAPA